MKLIDRATDYAKQVVSGEVVAGRLHILACERHLKDLERQGTAEFPYIWKPEKSERILTFAETLTIIEGFAPKQVQLYDFQCFDLGVLFGWYNLKGFRRFRRKYKSVARQNGKTFENGITGTYISAFSGYHYGKLFTAATKHTQASLAWSEIQKFIIADNDLAEYFKIQEYKSLITAINTNCTIEALSKERSLDDGARSIFNSIDEIHQHKDNSVYKTLYDGTRLLPETLNSMITTRGRNLNSFCREMDDYCINILKGIAIAEDFFVDIYCLDDEDNPFDKNNWIKSNPLLMRREGGADILMSDAQTAKDMGGDDLVNYHVKCQNMWFNSRDEKYIDADALARCKSKRKLNDFEGQGCYVGIDLSSGGDLTTVSLEFPYQNDNRQKYYIYSHSFMPRGRMEEHIKSDLAPYDLWEKNELITVTGGKFDYKNDYKFIISHLVELKELYSLTFLGIGIDPHNADSFLSDLDIFSCPVTLITQSARFLNEATEDMQLLVKGEDIEFDEKNELLMWSFVNAGIVKNSFGEMKVDKEHGINSKNKRIDPVDAVIDSHVLAKVGGKTIAIDTGKAMEEYLKQMGWKQ